MNQLGGHVQVAASVLPPFPSYVELRAAWAEAEALGADVLLVPDHFLPGPDLLEGGNFECFALLAGMAAATTRARIGSYVACAAFRNANLVADAARTIDHISGGRMILGMGAGWVERDFAEYGYEFGTKSSRARHLGAALRTVGDRLARLDPPPLGPLPLLVGGMGDRIILRLAARHADIWHGFGAPTLMAGKLDVLRGWCDREGRSFEEIALAATVRTADGRVSDPDALLELGFRLFIVDVRGPAYNFARLRELVEWRDRRAATVPR